MKLSHAGSCKWDCQLSQRLLTGALLYDAAAAIWLFFGWFPSTGLGPGLEGLVWLTLILGVLLALMALPRMGEGRCQMCKSWFTDGCYDDVGPMRNLLSADSPWCLMVALARFLVHCRRCGADKDCGPAMWGQII